MSKYDKCETVYEKVPVQFGHYSKDKRRCKFLGYIGSLVREPYWIENYYRIDKDEKSAGRFFYERRWKGDAHGNIHKDGKTWWYKVYTTYTNLPKEIKDEINKKEE